MKGGKAKAETKKADGRLAVKRKGTERAASLKSKKAAKDPNKPKRPASAFFVFMEEFRKQFKEKNPDNKSVAAVGKAGGAKWKSMTEAEKAPYVSRANKRKADFEKVMADYNKKSAKDAAEEENDSDKSKSEVHDDDEGDESDEDDDDE
ncbi:HMG1/2-like protein [Wolffia australiana]